MRLAEKLSWNFTRFGMSDSLNERDDSLRRLGPHSTTEDRLNVLRHIAEFWHGPIGPKDGFTEEELRGKPIPASLSWWFRLAGRRTWIMSGQNDLLGPEKLAVNDEGRLLFYVESQGVYLWATLPDGDDPIVLGRFNEPGIPWTEEGMVLSQFLIGACLFQAIMAAQFGASASWIDQATLDKLAAKLPELPLAPWRWPAFPGRFFARGGAGMFACPNGISQGNLGFSVWIGAKAAEPLAFLKNVVDRDWEYVALE